VIMCSAPAEFQNWKDFVAGKSEESKPSCSYFKSLRTATRRHPLEKSKRDRQQEFTPAVVGSLGDACIQLLRKC
jgi:hypothetical protein